MTHVELDIPKGVAERLRQKAEARGLTVQGYVADIVCRDVAGWPEGFFDNVVGGWKGAPLERPPQGTLEKRDDL